MSNKFLKKISTIMLIFFSFHLISCSNVIEVGFGEQDSSCLPINIWYNDLRIGLKSTRNAEPIKRIEVYCGITTRITDLIYGNESVKTEGALLYNSDFSQLIKFSLYRCFSTDFVNDNVKTPMTNIYSCENKLGYFFGEDFILGKDSYCDELTSDDMISFSKTGYILYRYELVSVDDDYIKLVNKATSDFKYQGVEIKKGDFYGPDSPYPRSSFSSFYCSIKYELTDNGIKLG